MMRRNNSGAAFALVLVIVCLASPCRQVEACRLPTAAELMLLNMLSGNGGGGLGGYGPMNGLGGYGQTNGLGGMGTLPYQQQGLGMQGLGMQGNNGYPNNNQYGTNNGLPTNQFGNNMLPNNQLGTNTLPNNQFG